MVRRASIDTRAAQLLTYSDRVYEAIDQKAGDETRARRIMRTGIQAVAHTLENGGMDAAGRQFNAYLWSQLCAGGIIAADAQHWPEYLRSLDSAAITMFSGAWHAPLDEFACTYADIERGTLTRTLAHETDASHAVHLGALALPYAATYYPDLNPYKVGVYSLLHDAPEAYAGDLPTLGASEAALLKKAHDEEQALCEIERKFGIEFPKFVSVISDYESLSDDESSYVKTFDKLDPKFTYAHSAGLAIVRDYGYTRYRFGLATVAQRNKLRGSYGASFPDVIGLHSALSRRGIEEIDWDNKKSAS